MATVQIVVPKYDARTGRPKMIIMGSNNDLFEVPWAPREVQHSDWSEEVVEIERAGRVPDIAVKAPKLKKMSFSLLLGRSLNASIENDLARLQAIVATGGWIQILYGPKESGLWKCTNMNLATVEREPVANQISRATVDFEFIEVPDSRKTVAKYSNDFNFRDDAVTASISQSIVDLAKNIRARNNAGTIGNPSGGITIGSGSGAVTIPPHIVQAGETLLSIAQKYYGEYGEQFWRLIGDYNKVVGKLNIGQMLRIP